MAVAGDIIAGRYEIVREIGRGGMSLVYLASDINLKKSWAVKEIRIGENGKQKGLLINSFISEADLMKRLDYPAFPRIVDILKTEEKLFVIMDYIEGTPLSELLASDVRFPEETVISWAKQLCAALSYLHTLKPPVIYRDMKPSNVLLTPDGILKIIDFGTAGEAGKRSAPGVGTRGYAPAEQLFGKTDERSDIYALGMTLFQLLTGSSPKEDMKALICDLEAAGLSAKMKKIIAKCVMYDPEERYQDCAALLRDLESAEKNCMKAFGMTRRRLLITALLLLTAFAVLGTVKAVKRQKSMKEYTLLTESSNPEAYYSAIELFPGKTEAYLKLVSFYRNHGADDDEIQSFCNALDMHSGSFKKRNPETAMLFYEAGKLCFLGRDASLKSRAAYALFYFEKASALKTDFEKKNIASCYCTILGFMTEMGSASEWYEEEYHEALEKIRAALEALKSEEDRDINFDRAALIYTAMLFLNDRCASLFGLNFQKNEVLDLLDTLHKSAGEIISKVPAVEALKEKINDSYGAFKSNIQAAFYEEEKRHEEEKRN